MINIQLSSDQYKTLSDALSSTQDEGPVPEGWKSSKLEALIDEIERQVNVQIIPAR